MNLIVIDEHPKYRAKKAYKEEHPNYRKFQISELPPIEEQVLYNIATPDPSIDYKIFLSNYKDTHGKEFKPVKNRSPELAVPVSCHCPKCSAPSNYLYYNDGKKRSQILCKVCNNLFQSTPAINKSPKEGLFCPHCFKALYKWKETAEMIIYKCGNNHCKHRLDAISKLSAAELKEQQKGSSQYKVCYQHRVAKYDIAQMDIPAHEKPTVDLTKIYKNKYVLGLVLTFYVSYALPARKVALILREVFGIRISHQTVLNYAESAAYHCHNFNLKHIGEPDDEIAGDETYVKVKGRWNYVWFYIGAKSHKLLSYYVGQTRGTRDAAVSLMPIMKSKAKDSTLTLISDGNPAYQLVTYLFNKTQNFAQIVHKIVVGLQNENDVAIEFRPLKQLIERLNRTFKYHVKDACGYGSIIGLKAITTLFATYYNFLRPHQSLNYNPPVVLSQLQSIERIQSRWIKILSMAG